MSESFGCCSSYQDCSIIESCIHPNNPEYEGCQYRKNLESGKNFYAEKPKYKTLSIDIETFSSVDLIKCGVYAYTQSPDFEIMLFAYSIDGGSVEIVDLMQGEKIPKDVLQALSDPDVIKTAYNANFERTCLARYFKKPMPAEQWRCTAVHAAYLGLPPRLGQVGEALKLPQDKQKMGIGYNLIRYFCVPCKPTKTNGGRTRNLPEHDPAKWQTFKEYCKRDVESEMTIAGKLAKFPVPESEWKLWFLDQKINDRGVMVDRVLAEKAIECDRQYQERLTAEAVKLTGLDNPKSVAQLKQWFLDTEDEEIESLNKKTVPKLIEKLESQTAIRVLELRQEMAKTSVKKYDKMLAAIGNDDRIRGLLQFYGANRTGRWAGRLVQVQNLPQNKMKELDLARQLLKDGDFEMIEMLFDSVPSVLSQLIRTAFIPSPGNQFIVSDFSAIEARVIAWLAGEKWRMEVFATHGKIYEASAAAMFKVPLEAIGKGSPLRQKGKIAELALGYQGGKGALITMGALDMGLPEEELPELVSAWRDANPNIVRLWWDVEAAAIKAAREKTTVRLGQYLTFIYESGFLFIRLPSGRRLAYVRPRIEPEEKFNKDGLTYEGLDQTSKQWGRLKTYGGKLVENIVQAIARDCLAESMLRLDFAGADIRMHVHDEVVIEEDETPGWPETINSIMGQPISWAPGLPLRADGFCTPFYRKD